MEALGSPSISRAPMGGDHAFRIQNISVYRGQVQRQYAIVRLPEIRFTASGFFVKVFDRFVRLCLCFNNNLQTGRKTHYCVGVLSLLL